MKIIQQAPYAVTICSLENGSELTFEQGIAQDVDEKTADHLLAMQAFDNDGNLVSDFTEFVN